MNTWYKVKCSMYMEKVCQCKSPVGGGSSDYIWICFQGNLVPDNYTVAEKFKAFVGANTASPHPIGNKHLNSSSKFNFNNGRTMRLFVRTGLGTFGIDIKPKKEKRKIGYKVNRCLARYSPRATTTNDTPTGH